MKKHKLKIFLAISLLISQTFGSYAMDKPTLIVLNPQTENLLTHTTPFDDSPHILDKSSFSQENYDNFVKKYYYVSNTIIFLEDHKNCIRPNEAKTRCLRLFKSTNCLSTCELELFLDCKNISDYIKILKAFEKKLYKRATY